MVSYEPFFRGMEFSMDTKSMEIHPLRSWSCAFQMFRPLRRSIFRCKLPHWGYPSASLGQVTFFYLFFFVLFLVGKEVTGLEIVVLDTAMYFFLCWESSCHFDFCLFEM